jgi:hypothetical protein
MTNEVIATVKHSLDVIAASVTVLTIIKVLPAITAGLAAIWYVTGLYEKITGRPFSESRFARFLTCR